MSFSSAQREYTERDFDVLRGLFECRIATTAHLSALYFEGRAEAAKQRIHKLKAAGVISERPRSRKYEPSVLFLTKRGFELLQREGRVNDYPAIGWGTMAKRVRVSPLTLRHELDVLSVKASI